MKKGKLQNWISRGQYGFVAVDFMENYFIHRSGIVDVPKGLIDPPIGATVIFDVAPPRKQGAYPVAINARIVLEESDGGVL